MRKILGVVLFLLITGCGGNTPAPVNTPIPLASPSPSPKPSPSPTVVISPTPTPEPFKEGDIRRGVPYCASAGIGGQEDIYYPTFWSGKPMSVLLYIHGGSWVSGDRGEVSSFGPLVDTLRAKSIMVVSIDYRLGPTNKWPAMLDDARCAVRSLRAHSGNLGINPNKIAVMGASAGGQLALLLALTDVTGATEYGAFSSQVGAVATLGAPTNMVAGAFSPAVMQAASSVFGPATPENSDTYTKASPISYISGKHTGPFFLVQGNQDAIVPFSQAQDMNDKLKANGDNVTLIIVTNADHTLNASGGPMSPTSAEVIGRVADFFSAALL